VPELADVAPYYLDWLAGPDRDDRWRALAPREHHHTITAPACNIGGWYDLFLGGTLDNYRGMRATGGSPRARSLQRLVVGPWSHSVHGGAFVGRDYGALSGTDGLDLTALQLRWFDHVLRDVDNGVDREPPVRLFVMGVDTWRDEHDWPLPDTRWTDQYLHSDGHAATTGGGLSVEPPGDEPCDVFRYDPHDPVPTLWGDASFTVAADQRPLADRQDILVYQMPPLDKPLETIGYPETVLYAASNRPDTDFFARLIDVAPDGSAIDVTHGMVRARHREALDKVTLLTPGETTEFHIKMRPTAHRFLAGHRIRLDITSSDFPSYDRNHNTSADPNADGELVTATQTVRHGGEFATRLVLPVMEIAD
jgi:putative CocE/NonD family hydrolase